MEDNYFLLNFLANLCQLADFQMNISQLSNDDLMKELQKQDKLLNENINKKLNTIIAQNEEIIELLRKESD